MRRFILMLAFAAGPALAQTAPTEFPAGAVPVDNAALQGALSGKVFAVKLADGNSWRLEYKSSGYFFIDTSRGYSDSGKWNVQEGRLCGEPRKTKASCNDVRSLGGRLFMKRDSGEVIEFVAQ